MEIIDVKKEGSRRIRELFEISFGKNYMSIEKIEEFIDGGTPFKMALEKGDLMGAILFIPASEEAIAERTKMDLEIIHSICAGKPPLICKCACVYEKYQGRGVSREILNICLEEIKRQKYGAVFTTLWEYNGSVPAEKMFVDAQFQQGKKLIMPWYDDEDYICSECGGRCRCNGIVYYKKL